MGQYITAASVKMRTAGKITYAVDDTDDNAVGPTFLDEIINEAETSVETRLSIRYAIPFQGVNGEAFSTLSNNTVTQIQQLCRMEAIRLLLAYDFGRGSNVDGEKYAEQNMRVYEAKMDRLVSIKENQQNQFKYPPLVDLALAPHNDQGDDGYAGRIYVTSDAPGGYAPVQMPDPGQTLWNGGIIDR
jgi:hypothetical protein